MGAIVRHGHQTGGVPVGADGGEEEQGQYLTFLLGEEMFAIPILNIKEIIEYGTLTTVPMMPEFIRGVINLRGSVVPVVDLSVRFGRKAAAATKRTCIVIIEIESEDEKQDVGVVVDSVSEVLEIQHSDIEQAPSFGARVRSDFIRGMGKIAGRFVIILDVNRVLSIDEMAMLGQAGGAKPEAAMLPG
ncbi:MAG: chemotaxis protein CheW [Nitrosomonadales bacterium]|nr:chemotaxis protein CheW [Nitrosomonadales bacterium]